MTLGIDGGNIRFGGGITHLKEFLDNAHPLRYGFEKVIIWSGKRTLEQLNEKEWLIKSEQALLNKSLPYIIYWQQSKLDKLVKTVGCDLLFCPAGTYLGKHRPYVVMSQNMLIFEKKERERYGLSPRKLRFMLLEKIQTRSFNNSSGIIFISEYAKNYISKSIDISTKEYCVINHGISERFRQAPRDQLGIKEYNYRNPFLLLYVSTIDMYKHQWNVVEAVAHLRKRGFPLELILVGDSSYKPAERKLSKSILRFDSGNEFIKYLGPVSFNEICENYKNADAFIFASSCENFPNVLLEAMAAGLPIACSDYGPMKEIYTEDGIYFDPLNIESISSAIEELIINRDRRELLAPKSFLNSQKYSWKLTADKTFEFFNYLCNR